MPKTIQARIEAIEICIGRGRKGYVVIPAAACAPFADKLFAQTFTVARPRPKDANA